MSGRGRQGPRGPGSRVSIGREQVGLGRRGTEKVVARVGPGTGVARGHAKESGVTAGGWGGLFVAKGEQELAGRCSCCSAVDRVVDGRAEGRTVCVVRGGRGGAGSRRLVDGRRLGLVALGEQTEQRHGSQEDTGEPREWLQSQ